MATPRPAAGVTRIRTSRSIAEHLKSDRHQRRGRAHVHRTSPAPLVICHLHVAARRRHDIGHGVAVRGRPGGHPGGAGRHAAGRPGDARARCRQSQVQGRRREGKGSGDPVGRQRRRRARVADARDRHQARGAEHPGQHHRGEHRRAARRDHHRLPAARHRRADRPRRRRGHLGERARPAAGRHHAERRGVHHGGPDRLAAARLHHAAVHAVPRRGRGEVVHRQRDRQRHQRRHRPAHLPPLGPPQRIHLQLFRQRRARQLHAALGARGQRPRLVQRRRPLGPADLRRLLRHHADELHRGPGPVRRGAQRRERGQRRRLLRLPVRLERRADPVADRAERRRQRGRQRRRQVQRRLHGQPGHRPQ